jgi:hypothetical protein
MSKCVHAMRECRCQKHEKHAKDKLCQLKNPNPPFPPAATSTYHPHLYRCNRPTYSTTVIWLGGPQGGRPRARERETARETARERERERERESMCVCVCVDEKGCNSSLPDFTASEANAVVVVLTLVPRVFHIFGFSCCAHPVLCSGGGGRGGLVTTSGQKWEMGCEGHD